MLIGLNHVLGVRTPVINFDYAKNKTFEVSSNNHSVMYLIRKMLGVKNVPLAAFACRNGLR